MSGGVATDSSQAVEVLNPHGAGAALILCEHASNHIPARYDGLGLEAQARSSHAAWDPGARSVALLMSAALDAPVVASCVSRLVYDCNRPPEAEGAIPEISEKFEIPGNRNLSPADREERVATAYRPFCDAVQGVIAGRIAAGRPTILITMHSFTPVYFDQARAVEIGILHDEDARLADAMLANAHLLPHRRIERNEPYGPADGVTHSLKIHGQSHGLANVMLEVRNDLLNTPDDERKMAEELLTLFTPALKALSLEGAGRA
ncbi:N-formylglutamate amidohydrolase [uncultured Roseovarius sp.]|uniref:N-formylglutamate amidohydrolase n=1 Tax=uncultured Roseovarius sp. TaxID=293344 RepID=UPI002616E6D9|nr:N-formylglutamate amidohydrolase [uncultured Roseovarius sp.]